MGRSTISPSMLGFGGLLLRFNRVAQETHKGWMKTTLNI